MPNSSNGKIIIGITDTAQARLMNESLGREVQSRRAAQAALGKRDREVERLQGEVAAYKVLSYLHGIGLGTGQNCA